MQCTEANIFLIVGKPNNVKHYLNENEFDKGGFLLLVIFFGMPKPVRPNTLFEFQLLTQ